MLVKIVAYQTAIEAHLARGRLEAEGIPAFVCHEHHVWADWPYSLALGGVKVYTHSDDAAQATTIVQAHNNGDYALPEEDPPPACPRCTGTRVTRLRISWKAALLSAHLAGLPLYFRWATLKCLACGAVWDLRSTRTYTAAVIALSAAAAAIAMFLLFIGVGCGLDAMSGGIRNCTSF